MTNSPCIRVLIVDDHAMMRIGLAAGLETSPDINLVGEASNGPDALRLCEDLSPDVVLMDLSMPEMDGVETTRRIHEQFPDIRVVALTSFVDSERVRSVLAAGAVGYLLKDVVPAQLAEAIRMACRGDTVLAPSATQVLIQSQTNAAQLSRNLTPREVEVLTWIAKGMNNNEIAERLTISTLTVKTHVSNMLTKLNASSRAEAVATALRSGLLHME